MTIMHLKIDKQKYSDEFTNYDSIAQKSLKFGFSWLDSSMMISDKGQNSFIMSDPIADIYLLNNKVHIKSFKDTYRINSDISDIYVLVEQLVHTFDLCAVGYISYESTLKKFDIQNKTKNQIPSTRFLLYENLHPIADNSLIHTEFAPTKFTDAHITNSISKNAYIKKVMEIKKHIKEGNIYQANFTTRFEISSLFSPFESYLRLRQLNPSPYGAYLNFGNYQILSSSPERIFTTQENRITTCPIKGTIVLGTNESEQQTNLKKLLNSEKDKAELLMIVDLMRNDLGRIAQTGTVSVDSLFKPEIYSSLIHLVSDISAALKNNITFADIINALIPGGSITGAPKKRAVEIINDLEEFPRFVYTGSIGYMTKEKADFNIAIRTIYYYNNMYYIHAGGGIVADSDPESEYDEMLLKAKNLFKAVGLQHV